GYLAIGVKTDLLCLRRQDVEDGFGLLFYTIGEHEAATDARDGDTEALRLFFNALPGHHGRILGALNKAVEIGRHQLGKSALLKVSGKDHRLALFVYPKYRADQPLLFERVGTQGEREEQPRRGKLRCALPQILFIKL